MLLTVGAEEFDRACIANQRKGGEAFRQALGRLKIVLTEDEGKSVVSIAGSTVDVETVAREIRPAPKPTSSKPVPARTASKQKAAERVAAEKEAKAAEKKTPMKGGISAAQAEAKARREAAKKTERAPRAKAGGNPALPGEKKPPLPKREKIMRDGVEYWACACGAEAVANQKNYDEGWRIPRGLTTAVCPACRAKQQEKAKAA